MSKMTGPKWWHRNYEILNGCTKVSEGCQNCFAESYANRFHSSNPRLKGLIKDGRWSGAVNLHPENLDIPLRTKKPAVWFVAERGDLFHEFVPFEFTLRVFSRMQKCPQHTFIVLTKRPERMVEFFAHWGLMPDPITGFTGSGEHVPDNIYFGTTVENQQRADERIPHLLKVPGKKILSVEPMLGPIDLHYYLPDLTARAMGDALNIDIRQPSIDGVICGGESGPGARPMHPDWARSLRDQCQAAGVPFFFKQWGEWRQAKETSVVHVNRGAGHHYDYRTCYVDGKKYTRYERDLKHLNILGQPLLRIGNKKAGRLLDGKEWYGLPWKL